MWNSLIDTEIHRRGAKVAETIYSLACFFIPLNGFHISRDRYPKTGQRIRPSGNKKSCENMYHTAKRLRDFHLPEADLN
jgi:hypothetical protein